MDVMLLNKRRVTRLSVLADGDSLTIGQGATVSYPNALNNKITINDRFMANVASGGQTSAAVLINITTHLDATYKNGYSNILSLMVGVNDIYFNILASTTIANILTIVGLARARGYKVSVNTTTPFYTYTGDQAAFDNWYAKGLILNDLIRDNAQSGGYNLVDVAANAAFNYQNAVYDTGIYNADLVHLINNGYDILATIVFDNWVANRLI